MENDKIKALKLKLGDVLKTMRAQLDTCEEEKRDMTEAERKQYKILDASIDEIKEKIKQEERLVEIEEESKRVVNPFDALVRAVENSSKPKPINGVARRCAEIPGYQQKADILPPDEFLKQLLSKRFSPELESMRVENRGTMISSGVLSGFAIPETLKVAVVDKMLADQGIYSRLGKEFIEGSDTLNVASLENCEIDAHGLYGFSYPEVVGEAGTISEGSNRWVSRSWHLKKLVTATKLSIESQIVGGDTLVNAVRDAIANVLRWGIERFAVRGEAVNFTGIIDSAATKVYGRATPNQISFGDIVGMLSDCRPGPGACWIASQDTIPQLAAMVDAGSHAVWLGNGSFEGAAGGPPTTLLGIPIIFTLGIAPTLGTKGDLTLCSNLADWFKLVMFSDIVVQTSDSAHWTTGETGMRIFCLMDMGALPTEYITIDGSSYGWAVTLL